MPDCGGSREAEAAMANQPRHGDGMDDRCSSERARKHNRSQNPLPPRRDAIEQVGRTARATWRGYSIPVACERRRGNEREGAGAISALQPDHDRTRC